MDALKAVEREIESVIAKMENVNDKFLESVTYLINFVGNLKSRIEEKVKADENYELTEDDLRGIQNLPRLVNATLKQTSVSHRAMHIDVSKVGKAIDRNFENALDETTCDLFPKEEDPEEIRIRRKRLNQAVCEHVYREGMYEVGELFRKEAGIELNQGFIEPLVQQHQILNALKLRDLGPAIDWVGENRVALAKNGSNLEFELHKLAFLLLVEGGKRYQEEAVTYARENLSAFAGRYESEIKTLMGTLMYVGANIYSSPYAHLFDQKTWEGACEIFQKDSCKVLGIPIESPLPVCVATGSSAIRTRSNVRQIIKERQSEHYWNVANGLPVDTKLGEEFQYHSIFACPVLRQQATEENPPMRLPCGHVVCRDALIKLVATNRMNAKTAMQGVREPLVKCPYCPVQDKAKLARVVKF